MRVRVRARLLEELVDEDALDLIPTRGESELACRRELMEAHVPG